MKRYNIGNVNVKMSVKSKDLKERLGEYRFETKEKDATLKVKYKKSLHLPKGELVAEHKEKRIMQEKDIFYLCVFAKDSDTLETVIRYDKLYKNVVIYLSKVLTPSMLLQKEYVYTGLMFQKIASQKDKFIIHGSALSHHGCGLIFSGPSGIGKSTQGAMWKEYMEDVFILNDDKPLISFEEKIFVYGTPWSGKTNTQKNMRAPLKAILFLDQGITESLEEVQTTEKIVLLLKNMFRSTEAEELDRLLDQLPRIIKEVKIFDFKATMKKESVDIIHEALFSKRHLERCQTENEQ